MRICFMIFSDQSNDTHFVHMNVWYWFIAHKAIGDGYKSTVPPLSCDLFVYIVYKMRGCQVTDHPSVPCSLNFLKVTVLRSGEYSHHLWSVIVSSPLFFSDLVSCSSCFNSFINWDVVVQCLCADCSHFFSFFLNEKMYVN